MWQRSYCIRDEASTTITSIVISYFALRNTDIATLHDLLHAVSLRLCYIIVSLHCYLSGTDHDWKSSQGCGKIAVQPPEFDHDYPD